MVYIRSRDYSDTRKVLEVILEESLDRAFSTTDYPAEKRGKFTESFIESLLSHDVVRQLVVLAVVSETSELSPALPNVAPATWRHSKLANDNPPDFIKRHYSPWLRENATGLTRPDIRKLDPSLYMALANWLRNSNNALPDDCPLPNKADIMARDNERFAVLGAEEEAAVRTVWRRKVRQERTQSFKGLE